MYTNLKIENYENWPVSEARKQELHDLLRQALSYTHLRYNPNQLIFVAINENQSKGFWFEPIDMQYAADNSVHEAEYRVIGFIAEPQTYTPDVDEFYDNILGRTVAQVFRFDGEPRVEYEDRGMRMNPMYRLQQAWRKGLQNDPAYKKVRC